MENHMKLFDYSLMNLRFRKCKSHVNLYLECFDFMANNALTCASFDFSNISTMHFQNYMVSHYVDFTVICRQKAVVCYIVRVSRKIINLARMISIAQCGKNQKLLSLKQISSN